MESTENLSLFGPDVDVLDCDAFRFLRCDKAVDSTSTFSFLTVFVTRKGTGKSCAANLLCSFLVIIAL